MIDLAGRHSATRQVARWFSYGHLAEPQRTVALECHDLAEAMIGRLPDGPELTAGLRRLLEAKDYFVRASFPVPPL